MLDDGIAHRTHGVAVYGPVHNHALPSRMSCASLVQHPRGVKSREVMTGGVPRQARGFHQILDGGFLAIQEEPQNGEPAWSRRQDASHVLRAEFVSGRRRRGGHAHSLEVGLVSPLELPQDGKTKYVWRGLSGPTKLTHPL